MDCEKRITCNICNLEVSNIFVKKQHLRKAHQIDKLGIMKTFEVFLIGKKDEKSGKYYFEKQMGYIDLTDLTILQTKCDLDLDALELLQISKNEINCNIY